ncbi:FAD-dependent oxidoreductase [Pseudomonas sp. SWRI59]|uniref:FAD-dependent oxidoreductase n=1 Tax=Pseudomonas TaxID=286 RepID=UPI001645ECC4|nr:MULTISPECIES: FAD-dependent oxidoreductase [unclassified Pseudomonas]MBC3503769.1 FAD-dependent oxidoreductase [Pseudomonas sp. SWRI59]MBC3508255.1 FAD-dependent oxidoreductase [Pseudomonas sp. SWRI68]UVL01823.1 FAD-dependent oxidoreductase [Pseudomonas sp. B21-047]
MNANAQPASHYDVIVVGSGAGAMTSALFAADQGLSVLVVEKSDKFGGTSAISGGGIWIPNNHYFAAKGGRDSVDLALRYLKAATGEHGDEKRLRAYLEHAPQMIHALEQSSHVRYAVAEKYPDYYPQLPGALQGGRTLDPQLFDTSLLGDELENLRKPSPSTLLMGRVAWTARHAHKVMSRSFGWRLLIVGLMLRYKLDFKWRRKGRRDRRAALGSALVASLRRSLMDRQVPLWLNTDFEALLTENGRVSGVQVRRDGQALDLHARHAVIFGSGGFEQNQALREQYLPQPTQRDWSATPPGNNTGAALQAGQALGAATALMDWAWWAPTIAVPGEDKPRGVFAERAFPGAIVVNGRGLRFVNEAAPYLEFVDAMYRDNQGGGKSIPAWVIFDGHFRFNYAMGPLMPAQVMPDSRLRKEWLNSLYFKADSLAALAGQIGVDAAGLQQTVARMNAYAQSGVDLEFGRGGNVFDRYYGDSNVKPNPCLAPLSKGPYYAMRLDAGDIGTKGGLLTNEHAQVVCQDGVAIPGLYAIGNCSASVMGTSYPGAGGTLGPAMTFGYIAARHIAAHA